MSSGDHHEEVWELLSAHAACALDDPDRRLVEEHLSECAKCTRELATWEESVLAAMSANPLTTMPPDRVAHVRGRLLERARGDHTGNPDASNADRLTVVRGSPSTTRPTASGARLRLREWAGWATAAGFASLLITHHSFHRPLELGWIAAAVLAVLFVAVSVALLRQRDRARELERMLQQRSGEGSEAAT